MLCIFDIMNLNDIKKKRYNDVCICYTLNWQRNDLKKAAGISAASIAKLGKGANINTDILLKISEAMDCKLEDIMETIKD